jgi:tetratricopeptide (TPR) repeat protein
MPEDQSSAGRTQADFDEAFAASYLYARHCFQGGDFERAVPLYEEAIRLRPDDYQALCLLVASLLKLGRVEQHAEVARRAMQAIDRQLAIDPQDGRALQIGTTNAATLGLRDKARDLAERARKVRPDAFASYYNVACAYSILGDLDDALEMLGHAVQHGRGNLEWIGHDPDFDNLRSDPRFDAIVNRIRASRGAPPT